MLFFYLGKKGSRSSKGSKASQKSESSASEVSKPTGPVIIGSCCLDLLPLFEGHRHVAEVLCVRKTRFFSLLDCASVHDTPLLQVRAVVEERLCNTRNTNILNVTVESLYNIPNIMSPEMTYKIATCLPNPSGVNMHFFYRQIFLFSMWCEYPHI